MQIFAFALRRLVAWWVLLLAACVLPAWAADISVSYVDAQGSTHGPVMATQLAGGEATTLGTAGSTTWYVCDGVVTYTDTLTIAGDVNLILAGACHLDVTAATGSSNAGINVTGAGRSLTVWAQSANAAGNGPSIEGHLTAYGDSVIVDHIGGAGIGGNAGEAGGTVTVHGGMVWASGGYFAAGIGGGSNAGGGMVTIDGGEVSAVSAGGAGIGGGLKGAGGTIVIGGNALVEAGGGEGSAGIGGGDLGAGGSVTIQDGASVTATGGDGFVVSAVGGGVRVIGGGAGIGSGENGTNTVGLDAGSITITTTGTVLAWGGAVGMFGSPSISGPGADIGTGGYGGMAGDVKIATWIVDASVAALGGGYISPWGSLHVAAGTSITFMLFPNPGYVLDSLTDNGVNVTGGIDPSDNSYTLSAVAAGHTLVAAFSFPSDARLASVAGVTPLVSSGGTGTAADPIALSVTLPNIVSSLTVGQVKPANANATVQLLTDNTFATPASSVPLSVGANHLFVKVTAEDGTELFYDVTVTRSDPISVSYVDAQGGAHGPVMATQLVGRVSGEGVTLGTAGSTTWYVCDGAVSYIPLTGGLTIAGDVNLILADTCVLDTFGASATIAYVGAAAGINITVGSSLTVWAQSANAAGNGPSTLGSLTARGGSAPKLSGGFGAPGIGGTVTVHGGTVMANGGYSAAGIVGIVTIDGGTVIAEGGGLGGAGIGGSFMGTGVTVVIGGSASVTAIGGRGAAGIGGGNLGAGGSVTIQDGASVTATGGDGAGVSGGGAGIGSGTNGTNTVGLDAGSITINTTGTVTATGGAGAGTIGAGAAIGQGGYDGGAGAGLDSFTHPAHQSAAVGGSATFTCSATLAAGGGALAWEWLIDGTPQGLNNDSLTRTPVTAGMNGNQHVCEAIVTNVGAGSYIHYYSNPATLTVTSAVTVPVITTPAGALVAGAVGVPYSVTLAATNSPTGWTVTSGALPPGLALGNDGKIAGTPTTAGDYSFSVTASNTAGDSTEVAYMLKVSATPVIITPAGALAAGAVGVPYSVTLVATNDPASWAVTNGALPPGLALGNDGKIAGTPTTEGDYSFSVTASNAAGESTVAYTLKVSAAPVITVSYVDAQGGAHGPVTATQLASGGATTLGTVGSATWYVCNGEVKYTNTLTIAGDVNLILADACVLDVSGVATTMAYAGINFAAGSSLTVWAQSANAAGNGPSTLGSLTAQGSTALMSGGTGAAGIGGNAGQPGGMVTIHGGTITAQGGYSAAGIGGGRSAGGGIVTIDGGTVIAKGGGLGAAGIGGGLEGAGGTVVIGGSACVTATGGGGAAGIGGGNLGAGGSVTIQDGACVTATGGDGVGVSGGGAGIGSGTNGTNAVGLAAGSITITTTGTVLARGGVEGDSSGPGAAIGQGGYDGGAGAGLDSFTHPAHQSAAVGGSATFTCSATLATGGGALAWEWLIDGTPQGLNNDNLTRTPVTAAMNGNQHVCEAIVTNVGAGSYIHYYSNPAMLTVTSTVTVPVITTPAGALAAGAVGVPYSLTLAATNSPTGWTVTRSALPPGLALGNDGKITGTPTTAGDYSFSVTASNTAGDSTEVAYTLKVSATPVIITPAGALAAGAVGVPYSVTLVATNDPTGWAVTSGALPPGLALSDDGKIAGTPTTEGDYSFSVTASNAVGDSTVAYTLKVSAAPVITVSYVDAQGGAHGPVTATQLASGGATTLGTEGSTTWYVCDGAVTYTDTLTIAGDVNLILADACVLNVTAATGRWNAGINVTGVDRSLTVWAQSANAAGNGPSTLGSLTAHGGTGALAGGAGGAGIGGNAGEAGGTVAVHGGTVMATGGYSGAGIGGGRNADGGTVTIDGGTVSATVIATGGGLGGAGVGGGFGGAGGTVVIGGSACVTATGGGGAAGIGGGNLGAGGSVTIQDGACVTATGGDGVGVSGGGAGIGSGTNGTNAVGLDAGSITINTTGTVTATGGASAGTGGAGAAIGQGGYAGAGAGLDSFTHPAHQSAAVGGSATFTCSATLATGGGALAWEWLIGGTPQGLNADSLTRTPVAAAMNGNQHVCEAIVTNVGAGSYIHYYSNPATLTVTSTVTVPVITTPAGALAAGAVGVPYSLTLAATNSPTGWTVTSGALPAGLALGNDGKIAGTPTTAGDYSFSVTASNTAGDSTEVAYTLKVSATPVIITPAGALTEGAKDTPYSLTLVAANNPTHWEVTSGALPPGLALSDDGKITGTPTTEGDYSFSVKATNAAGESTEVTYTLKIGPPGGINPYGGATAVPTLNEWALMLLAALLAGLSVRRRV